MHKVIIINDYIVATGILADRLEDEPSQLYLAAKEKLSNKPTAEDGYEYKLRADTLEWELVEKHTEPPAPENDELTAEEALDIITGGAE